MKKLVLAMSLLAFSSAGAFAADLAARPVYTKAPGVIAAVYDWSGFYVGINGGYGTSHKCWDVTGIFAGPDGCHDATGGVFGGQVGYRLQTGPAVFGVEAQGDWARLSGSNMSLQTPAFTNRSRIDGFGLFTGQIGYSFNTVLLYAKGGAAVTADRFDVTSTPSGALAATTNGQTRWGGTVGTGLEFGFAPNWSAAIEYDHLFMGSKDATFTATIGGLFGTERISQDVDLITARVNYRFGGPVVARY